MSSATCKAATHGGWLTAQATVSCYIYMMNVMANYSSTSYVLFPSFAILP